MIIRAQMRGLSPFSYMTFYVETLEDLFCIAPSSVSQLIDPHLSFVPQTLTEPLVSATHCTGARVAAIMEDSVHRKTFLSLPNSFEAGLLHSPFTCSVHSCFHSDFLPGNISPRKLATTSFQSPFLPFLEISPSSRSGRCYFPSQPGLS